MWLTVTDYFNRPQIDEAFTKLKEKGINQEDYDIKVNKHIWPTEKERSLRSCSSSEAQSRLVPTHRDLAC